MHDNFSDYIIFADESGDHGTASVNPENPIFVLVFCIFRKFEYISLVKRAISKFKMDFWGHDLVVLHNREIRKSTGEFSSLFNERKREIFLQALNEVIGDIPFSIAATAIDKRCFSQETQANNPYFWALRSCLEQLLGFLTIEQQLSRQTHIIVESRGAPEDKDLRLAFNRFAVDMFPDSNAFNLRFASKQTNSSGLQIADLVAHPIARHIIKRNQLNKAFDVLKEKLLGFPEYEGKGLKLYPLESEMPRLTSRQGADRELPVHL